MKLLPSILLAMTKNNKRDFQFVPSGQSYSSLTRPTISCDGRIPGGVTLELTHWTDNETPNHLYADTSTEMALQLLAQQPGDFLENALVLNNHYDTDGVLSSWACLVEPEVAIQYADLLREGAEAGDFGEWSSDNGIKLNEAVEAMRREDDDEKAYKKVFQELPSLLDDIQVTGGESYKHLWAAGFEHALDSWKELESRAKIKRGPGRIAILCESPSFGRSLSPYALHRGLQESNLWEETTRILRVTDNDDDDTRKKYVYEQIGHGWVQKLVKRPTVPDISDKSQFVAHLNSNGGANWRVDGGSSLVSICQWNDADAEIQDVAAALHRTDSGSQ